MGGREREGGGGRDGEGGTEGEGGGGRQREGGRDGGTEGRRDGGTEGEGWREAACRFGDDVSRHPACMHPATRVLTCSGEEDVLDRERVDFDDEKDALAARRPVLFRPSSPWTSISIHNGQAPS